MGELLPLHRTPVVLLHEMYPSKWIFNKTLDRPDITQHAYVQYYVYRYLPSVSRTLWMDTDTLVKSDVSPLFWMGMKHAIAAVCQRSLGWYQLWFPQLPIFLGNSWDASLPAFNTGVLVYNLEL